MKKVAFVVLLIITACVLSQAQRQNSPSQPPTVNLAITDSNNDLEKIFRSGGEAFIAGRYTEAIQIYEQGLKEYPDQPDLWVNKALSLLSRSSATHVAAARTSDEVLRKSGMEAMRQDVREAVKAVDKAVGLIKDMPVPTEPAFLNGFESLKLMSLRTRANAYGALATQVDESYATSAFAAYQDYINAETEPELIHGARIIAARMLLMANRSNDSFEEYQKLLDVNLDDVEALLGAGVALVNSGFATKEQPKIQRGIEYLQRFVEKAPTSHRMKGSTEEALDYLKRARGIIDLPSDEASNELQKLPIESGVVNGKAVSLPQPPYPLIAKFARAEGTVDVQVLIDERGNVLEASAVTGHPLLRGTAAAAALRAKFTPTLLSGKPVKVTGIITYNFVKQ